MKYSDMTPNQFLLNFENTKKQLKSFATKANVMNSISENIRKIEEENEYLRNENKYLHEMLDNKSNHVIFSPYSKCRVKLTYTGAIIVNNYLEDYQKKIENNLIGDYMDDYGNFDEDGFKKELEEYKNDLPQRYKIYCKGDYFEDDFDFIMTIFMEHMAYNKLNFSNIFCYVGDGDEDRCFFEIVN